jgi:hypothetical protein
MPVLFVTGIAAKLSCAPVRTYKSRTAARAFYFKIVDASGDATLSVFNHSAASPAAILAAVAHKAGAADKAAAFFSRPHSAMPCSRFFSALGGAEDCFALPP